MFSNLVIHILYILLAFTNTVLTHSTTTNTKPKGLFTDVPLWLLSLMILLGIVILLLIIYLIIKFIKRRKRREDEGFKQSENKEEEITEKLETSHYITIYLNEDDVKFSIKKENSTCSVNHTNGIDDSSLLKESIQFNTVEAAIEQDLSSKSKEEEQSNSEKLAKENYSSVTIDGYTSTSIVSLLEYEHGLELKEVEEITSADSSQDEEADVKEPEEETTSADTSQDEEDVVKEAEEFKCGDNPKDDESDVKKAEDSSSINSPQDEKIKKNISSQVEESERSEIVSEHNDLGHEDEQEPTSVQEENEIPETNSINAADEKVIGDIKIPENLKEDIIDEKAPEETVVVLDDIENESVTDSISVEVEDISDNEKVVTEEGLVEEIYPQAESEGSLEIPTNSLETATVSGNSSGDFKEEGLISKENLIPPEKYLAAIKKINVEVRKNPRTRRFSHISSYVLKDAGKNIDNGSTGSEYNN